MNTETQLFAKIRADSKYYNQAKIINGQQISFPVFIDPKWINSLGRDGGIARGGPGGSYKICDIDLYIKSDASEFKIS